MSPKRVAQTAADRRLQLLLDSVTDCAIYMTDPSGIVASWNAGGERIMGYTADEIVGHNHSKFWSAEERASGAPAELLRRARKSGRTEAEGWRLRKDGSRFWALVTTEPIRDERKNLIGFAKIMRDMTEREAARQALIESERQLRLLIGGVTDYALYMLDPNGIITSWNPGAEKIKGYSSDEVIGRHFSVFYTAAERLAGIPRRALETAASTGRYEAEGLRVRKDGSQFWASAIIDAIRDEKGQLIGFAKITRDITEKKDAQEHLRKVEGQLALQQKMEALGQLTGGIAHDFNNLLMIIGGQADILKRKAASEKDARAFAAIEHAVKQGARLTGQMLAFARAAPHTPTVVKLGERVNTYRDLLSSSARGDIEFVSDIGPDIWPVLVDAGEFDLALINLAVNARDAMPSGGTITLAMQNRHFGNDAEIGLKGEFVAVSVSDNGVGIAPEHLSRVFEPFFTTKAPGKGTGLGLSQVYGFARASGGTAQIASRLGVGTTVTLFLPRTHRAFSEAPPAPEVVETQAATPGTVLVVEDNRQVAEVSTALVEQIGYRTISAETALDALKVLETNPDIALVFSDIVMPGEMDGLALARLVRERYPEIPVLLTSGYSRLSEAAAENIPILRKPYEVSALTRAVTQAIRSHKRSA